MNNLATMKKCSRVHGKLCTVSYLTWPSDYTLSLSEIRLQACSCADQVSFVIGGPT